MMKSYKYRLERSKRTTLQLKICPDGSLLVKAPLNYPVEEIDKLIQRHTSWIEKHRILVNKRTAREQAHAQTPEQIEELYQSAYEVIPQRVKHFSQLIGVTPTGIKITSAAKRFGSCNTKNSLCFSYRLMMYPPEAIDYVVVHELAHIRHHDHSPAFYSFVASILPDYSVREAMLKEYI